MAPEIPITALLRQLGYRSDESQVAARAALEAAGLTRTGRRNIAEDKRARVAAALGEAIALTCGEPACNEAVGTRTAVAGEPGSCEICGGRSAMRASARLAAQLHPRGPLRVLVVGGDRQAIRNLHSAAPQGLHLTVIDGLRSRTRKEADRDVAGQDLIVLWATTPLDHAVSNLYRGDPRTITVARRSAEAVIDALSDHLQRPGPQAGR